MFNGIFKNRIFANASWLIGCKIVKAILAFIITILSARYLGPSNYGLISYAASIVIFVEPIAQLGLRDIQVHELINSPNREGAVLGTSIVMTIFSAIASMIGVVCFAYFANPGEYVTWVVCGLYSLMMICQIGEMIQYWFQAKYIVKYASVVNLSAYFVVSIYKFILLITKMSVYWFAIANALDFLIISVALLILYYKKGGQKLSFSSSLAKNMLQRSKHFIIPNLMISVFSQTDRIMIKFMIDSAAVGFYSAAITCASIANFVFLAVIDAARPSIFESFRKNRKIYERRLSQLYCVVIYASLFMSLGMTLFSSFIIKIAYGEQYMAASSVLQIAVWFSTFSYIGTINGIWILSEKKQKYLWIINLSGALANIFVNYLLIPKMGIDGAAVASLITQLFANIVVISLLKPTRNLIKIVTESLNPNVLFRK